ncbi:MAG: PilZ domain-containing protein [Candidatus Eremiobacteraeota bacterium]|nr:PilZ domain-containing protein [Candidatus Eremiobacteraeota bacterium]
MQNDSEKRLFSRIGCGLDLTLRRQVNNQRWAVSCRDLSLSGLGLRQAKDIQVGEEVQVTLEGFPPVQAQVRWHSDRGAGLSFQGSLSQIADTWVGEVLSAHGIRVKDLLEKVAG